jgi:hypothetical protein
MRILVVTLTLFCLTAQAYNPAHDLQMAFGGRCDSLSGRGLNRAMADGSALGNIIQQLATDKNCSLVRGALQQVSTLTSQRHNHSLLLEDHVRRKLQTVQDLQMTIAFEELHNNDPIVLQSLKRELAQAQVDLIASQGLSDADQRMKKKESIQAYQEYTTGLMQALSNSQLCLAAHPNIIGHIGAQLLSMSSSFVSGVAGSILYATGSILNEFLEFMRTHKINHTLKKLNTFQSVQSAFCATESMARTYCEARDVERLIERVAKLHLPRMSLPPKKLPPVFQAVKLMGHAYPSFNQWTTRLLAGSDPTSSSQANAKIDGRALQESFLGAMATLKGAVFETAKKLNYLPSDTAKNDELLALADDLARTIHGNIHLRGRDNQVKQGPFYVFFQKDQNCGPLTFLLSPTVLPSDQRECQRDSTINESCRSCLQRKMGHPPTTSIKELQNRVEILEEEAGATVNLATSLSTENNPRLVLARIDTQLLNNKTPREFLAGAYDYLQELKTVEGFPHTKVTQQLVQETKLSIKAVLTLIENIEQFQLPAGDKPDQDPQVVVNQLASVLTRDGDSYYFSKKIQEIVKQHLDYHLDHSSDDGDVDIILQLSPIDSLSTILQQFFGLDAARTSAIYAQEMARNNLQVFSEVFGQMMSEQIMSLDPHVYKVKSRYNHFLADMCIRTLLLPDSPVIGGVDIREKCGDIRLYSVFGFLHSLYYPDFSSPKSWFEDRVCLVYDFYRRSRLIERTGKWPKKNFTPREGLFTQLEGR